MILLEVIAVEKGASRSKRLTFRHKGAEREDETTMTTKKSTWIIFSILVISIWVLGPAVQVEAETINGKLFNHVTRREAIPVGDVEGHLLSLTVREGVMNFDNGEVAWIKGVIYSDSVKGSGSMDQYITLTFEDGSTITSHSKGTFEASSADRSAKWMGEITKGTGRFQGIKGTMTAEGKFLPLEKGELGSKVRGEATYNYTLPSK
jgi:hypothetical protein